MTPNQRGTSRIRRFNHWIAVHEPLIRLIYRILIILGLAIVAWELYGTDQDDQDENESVESVNVMPQPDLHFPQHSIARHRYWVSSAIKTEL